MRIFCAVTVMLLWLHGPAQASFSAGELGTVAAAPAPGAALPLALGFRDEMGQPLTLKQALRGVPGVVIFADYTCHTLCGPILDFAADGLEKTGLSPGKDYRVIVIGLDPKDALDAARAMKAAHFGNENVAGRAATFLTGRPESIAAATAALGYHYRYDAQHDQFAHPAAVYVTDGNGKVARVLSGVGLDGADLRLALVDAGHGAVGTFLDRIRLHCYGYDPARGIYTERITFFLEIAAGISVLVLAGGIFTMIARERRPVAR